MNAPGNINPLRRLYISLLLLIAVLGFGICGFMLIEGFPFLDAAYMTVITVSTVGFMEVHPLSRAGRSFTILLILSNIGIFTYLISQLSVLLFDGELRKYVKTRHMKQQISRLRGHVILAGFGRTGHEAARIFQHNHTPFVIVEQNLKEEDLLHIPTPYFLQADATRDEVLKEAGILNASALITTLPDDADNVFVVLTARELNEKVQIISRCNLDSSISKLRRAGASNVIMPDKIGGAHMATLLVKPDLAEFFEILSTKNSADFQVAEMLVSRKISIRELDAWQTTGATILGVKKTDGEYILNPSDQCELHSGFRLIAMGGNHQLDKLKMRLNNLVNEG